MSMCVDLYGRTWIGTEEDGVYCYDRSLLAANRWKHYTTSDGLGDNCAYAVCCDRLGRIWVGGDRTGVSVFNGRSWKNYDQVTGPLGGHVYAMAASPADGSIWIATEGGLSRYSEHDDTWENYIYPCNIALNQITCMAFNKFGDVVLGTESNGIVIGRAFDAFKTWSVVYAPTALPTTPAGYGLPTGQINCLAAKHDGTICAGTHDGLAESLDGGFHWTFIRGQDYIDKLTGLYAGRRFQPSVSGIELMTPDAYAKLSSANIEPLLPWIAIVADAAPADQLGAHITVNGGETSIGSAVVDTSRIPNPAPPEVYQGEREGEFSYVLSNLTPNAPYMLRLHFAELDYDGPGQRLFSVLVNSAPLLKGLDIYALAGGRDIGLAKDFAVTADSAGSLTLRFTAPESQITRIAVADAALPLQAQQLMSEDYVASFCFGPNGDLYIGHWTKGVECYDPRSKIFQQVAEADSSGSAKSKLGFIQSMLATASGSVLLGPYGGSMHIAGPATTLTRTNIRVIRYSKPSVNAAFPSPATPPTDAELAVIGQTLTSPSELQMQPGEGCFLGADWATQGDWVGRYGSRRAILCAADSPFDHDIANDMSYTVAPDIGPNREEADAVRRWIQWLRTDDSRVLYDPVVGIRRESEWDDHGEDYPLAHQGPDIWVKISVPAGVHRVTAYFVNKDGHDDYDRTRDYLVELLPYRPDKREAAQLQPLASARVRCFWDGVYESFAVCGPAQYYIAVKRNNSINAIVSAIFFDKILGPPTPFESFFSSVRSVYLMSPIYAAYVAPPAAQPALQPGPGSEAEQLWQTLANARCGVSELEAVEPDRLLCFRALAASSNNNDSSLLQQLGFWRRSLPYVTQSDRDDFEKAMSALFDSEKQLVPSLATGNL